MLLRIGLEPGELLRGSGLPVSDVVDAPGQCVDRRQRPALRLSKQPDAVREVLRLPAGDGLAVVVGDLGVHELALFTLAATKP